MYIQRLMEPLPQAYLLELYPPITLYHYVHVGCSYQKIYYIIRVITLYIFIGN